MPIRSLIEDYKRNFANVQSNRSNHPYKFWLGIAEILLENRAIQQLDLFIPLGNWTTNWTVFGFLVNANNKGIELEKEQGMEKAFAIYEVSVAENFTGTQPYDRLRVWYTKNKQYKDALRVCQAFVDNPHGNPKSKEHFQHHAERIVEKLDKENRTA